MRDPALAQAEAMAPAAEAGALARMQSRIAILALGAMAAACIYAAIEWRSLAADGFYYFLRMLQFETFKISWVPQRHGTEILHEVPIIVAMRLGISDVGTLALVYGLTTQLAPLALVALCYPVLPRERKLLFVFPLLHYLACSTGALFVSIHAGPTGAAYFWLLFFLVLFAPPRLRALVPAAIVALPAATIHESMVFLAPVLCVAAVWRARRERKRPVRGVFIVLALWFAAVAALQVAGIAAPADAAQRDGFIRGLLRGRWLAWQGGVNLPMVLGTLALLLLALFAGPLDPRKVLARQGCGRIAVAALGLAAAAMLPVLFILDMAAAPQAQFAARNNAALASLPLAVATLCAIQTPGWLSPPLLRLALAFCAVLAAAAVAYDVLVTSRWAAYLADYRMLLREHRGYVAWDRALASLPRERQGPMRSLTWSWISPSMSLVLAHGGSVTAIIANPPSNEGHWQPFDPRSPEAVPRSRFWDVEPYARALAAQKAAGELR